MVKANREDLTNEWSDEMLEDWGIEPRQPQYTDESIIRELGTSVEGRQIARMMKTSIKSVMAKRLESWLPTQSPQTYETSSPVGVKVPSTRGLEARAALRGQPFTSDKLMEATRIIEGEVRTIDTFQLHILLDANPLIAMVPAYQRRALEALKAVLDLKPQDLYLDAKSRVKSINVQVDIGIRDARGFGFAVMPEHMSAEDAYQLYLTCVEDSVFGDQSAGYSLNPVAERALMNQYVGSRVSDDPEGGIMNTVILVTPGSEYLKGIAYFNHNTREGQDSDQPPGIIAFNTSQDSEPPVELKPAFYKNR